MLIFGALSLHLGFFVIDCIPVVVVVVVVVYLCLIGVCRVFDVVVCNYFLGYVLNYGLLTLFVCIYWCGLLL